MWASKKLLVLLTFLLATVIGTAVAQTNATWGTQADSLRGRNGERFAFICPPGGTVSGRLWGTELYTDDSSICTAAVHTGGITTATGGTVTIEIRSGAGSYRGSQHNGVTSSAYGGWSGSFVIISAIPGNDEVITDEIEIVSADVLGRAEIITANWGTQADNLRGRNDQVFRFACPSNGKVSGRLWGTRIYTDDSSLCTAAVHMGLITTANGGVVAIKIKQGVSSYRGSVRNSVTSNNYGAWPGSFVFLRSGSVNPGDNILPATWATQADSWRGRNGERFRLRCPSGGTVSGRLWGTELYTDDSSICTAAVHSGLISTSGGGIVVIEIRAGSSAYRGSQSNGVTSSGYGGWPGSFVFIR